MGKKIENLAVLTSGGDAPGMNACIRAVVRTAIYNGLNVFGVSQGYQGMIQDQIFPMTARDVSNTISLGGTILKTARCLEFKTPEGMETAYQNLKKRGIDAFVAIGGDGTFTGANLFYKKYDIKVMGVPGTIDNDLGGTDYTIGYDTATNTVIDAIDKIRDTAESHDRLFFIEVMGRDSGCIALHAAIAGGAEIALLPEYNTDIKSIIKKLKDNNKKTSSIVIVAEGNKFGGAYEIAKRVKEKFTHYDVKVTILGHLQRGGSPSSFDRILGSRLGFAAVKALIDGESGNMVGLKNNKVVSTPIEEALSSTHHFKLENDLLEMIDVLSI